MHDGYDPYAEELVEHYGDMEDCEECKILDQLEDDQEIPQSTDRFSG